MPKPDGSPAGPGKHRLEEAGPERSAVAQECNGAPKAEVTL